MSGVQIEFGMFGADTTFPDCILENIFIPLPSFPLEDYEIPKYSVDSDVEPVQLNPPQTIDAPSIPKRLPENIDTSILHDLHEVNVTDEAPEVGDPEINIPSFEPTSVEDTDITFPDPIELDTELRIEWDDVRYEYLQYLFNVVPVNISFNIPEPQIPQMNFSVDIYDINVPAPNFVYVDQPAIYSINFDQLTFMRRGGFIHSFGYDYPAISLYRIRNLMDGISFESLKSFYLYKILATDADVYIKQEEVNFSTFYTQKELDQIRLLIDISAAKSAIAFTISSLKSMLELNRLKITKESVYTGKAVDFWKRLLNLEADNLRNIVDAIKNTANTGSEIVKLNVAMRDIFYEYKSLINIIINTILLNIERERLLIDFKAANMELKTAKEKENLAPELSMLLTAKRDSLLEKIKAVTARYDNILKKVEAVNERIEALRKSLQVSAEANSIELGDLRLEAEIKYMNYSTNLLERAINGYLSLHNEYFSLATSHTRAFYNARKIRDVTNINLNSMREMLKLRQKSMFDTYLEHIDALRRYVLLHVDASKRIANANITSSVVEAYR